MSSMDNILHTYLCRLKIIAKLPVNGKFDTTNNDLNIYYSSISGWVWRKFQGDSKERTVKYLMDLYREIRAFTEQTMYHIRSERDIIQRHKKMLMLTSLAEKIKESLYGIKNLIGTYKDYIKIVSLLECLEQDIIIPMFNTIKEFLPKYYHTEIIKSDILYNKAKHSYGRAKSAHLTIGMGKPPSKKMIHSAPELHQSDMFPPPAEKTTQTPVNEPNGTNGTNGTNNPLEQYDEGLSAPSLYPSAPSPPIDIPKKLGREY